MTETKVGAKIQVDVDLIDTMGIATGVLLPLGSLSKGLSICLARTTDSIMSYSLIPRYDGCDYDIMVGLRVAMPCLIGLTLSFNFWSPDL